MRLGHADPLIVTTTTPKPRPWLKELVAEPRTRVAKASTYDNLDNLSPVFAETSHLPIRRHPPGPPRAARRNPHRRRRRPVDLGDDRSQPGPGHRRPPRRAPASSSPSTRPEPPNGQADETGIIVVGIDGDGPLRARRPLRADDTRYGWANAVDGAVEEYQADAVVAETNYGGDMVTSNLRNAGADTGVIGIHSRRGKADPGRTDRRRLRTAPRPPRRRALRTRRGTHRLGADRRRVDSPNRLDALVHGATALLGRRAASSFASPTKTPAATPRRHLGPLAGRPERWLDTLKHR